MFRRVLDHCLEIPTLAPTDATHSIVRLTILYVFVPQVRADVFACNTSLGFCEEMRQWQRAFSCMLHMKASKQVGISQIQSADVSSISQPESKGQKDAKGSFPMGCAPSLFLALSGMKFMWALFMIFHAVRCRMRSAT